jgi:hypothetical protein
LQALTTNLTTHLWALSNDILDLANNQ